tara:strand:- start:2664 stop:3035 length:372 start_codon:yes stop_codon:yes gene_type:complete
MTIVNKVDKKVKMSKDGVIKYQILTFCFLNDIQISVSDLECLSVLAGLGDYELTSFCKLVAEREIFKSPQSARNAITKAEKKKLVKKIGNNRKSIRVNSEMSIQTEGTILLDYKFLGIEPKRP